MLHRFVAASAVGGVVIACAAVVLATLTRIYVLKNPTLLTVLWCMVPLVWGVWAILTPKTWMPARLPQWGAVLGCVVAILGVFVLNVPMRVIDVYLRMRWRGVAMLVGVAVYYLLWMVVRAVYMKLAPPVAEKVFKAAA